jgi:glutamate synthase domain-containing protein 3
VVVLGPTGGNFGAGMTGGTAFVYDRAQSLPDLVNAQDVVCEAPDDEDFRGLLDILAEHVELTGSHKARTILNDWESHRAFFWKVLPLAVVGPPEAETETAGSSELGVVGSSSLGA